MAPSWFSPTELVEQLLCAPARSPTESEQAFTGALTLTKGDDCVVVFVPVLASCPGRRVLPITLASAVIGNEIESGNAATGARGFAGAATGTAGAAAGAAGGVVAWAIAAEVALSTFCTAD
jgi:hypothetical protein